MFEPTCDPPLALLDKEEGRAPLKFQDRAFNRTAVNVKTP